MSITVSDILKTHSFSDAEIVVGSDKLNKDVSGIYLAETFPHVKDALNWLNGGELLFVIGHEIFNKNYSLEELIVLAAQKNISSVIIFLGKYINNISETIIELCDKNDIPLITLPWYIRYIEASHEIYNLLATNDLKEESSSEILDAILFSSVISYDAIMQSANAIGFNLNKPHRILVIDIKDAFSTDQKTPLVENEILYLQQLLIDSAEMASKAFNIKTIHVRKALSLIVLIPASFDASFNAQVYERFVYNYLNNHYNVNVNIGISSPHSGIDRIKSAYSEASLVQKTKELGLISGKYYYSQLGFLRLLNMLNKTTELEKLYPDKLSPLIEHDKTNNLELVKTLEIFLSTNRSFIQTSKLMYIHKNTVKYRIQRIKEMTDFDLNNPEICFELQLEYKICKFLRMF